ncbi:MULTISPECIES: substrate-binding and vWA domain-containing protein [Streptomyces]|uniref:Putative membrane protein n=2 Tax=Streptomyces scabiei TaxID=1930 RepID=C9ZGQ6_STRSW|nr:MULTISPECIES: substrate-binding and VWA domain-containing protein [Streptomyces]KFG05928.1 von Willebrand factor A [Streptomyces scabiei]MBP5891302.1 VWA domain-containing protein [Streptomyces sp. LBUM 1481]MBP5921457.1 VWA domain-containing protein [Streptomyces sp. LBUM 1483]MDX2540115.1 substrate-binding and VWA domain-containing protein [Streptomyces scabiei]MDX2579639.1 substrate-binding and VWA domain-containing protein [Streptomyces scabiei]
MRTPTRAGAAARTRTRTTAAVAAVASLVLLATAACTGADRAAPGPAPAKATPYVPGTLRVLASSELADMKPVLERVEKDTGIKVRPTYMGTLDAVDLLARRGAKDAYDAVWLSSNDYLRLRPDAARQIVSQTPVMSSPVAIGVKNETVGKLGWKPDTVTWSDIENAVADGKLTYGMTDPSRSNSGFSTLISVASGLSGAQSALTDADVARATPRLKRFFAGQKLTSGSSGWLATAYDRRGDVDALLNYESVLKSRPDLTVIRPRDGVVTADYPLSSLASTGTDVRDDVRRLTDALRTPDVQRLITERTLRRPVVASVPPAAGLDTTRRRELPFPGSRSVAVGLLDAYENDLRRPSRTVYVLDTSGSMEGDRLDRLKTALTELTGDFRDREEVTLMPFGSDVKSVRTHVVRPADPKAGLDGIRADTRKLSAAGETAIYTSLRRAYEHLGAVDRDTFTSIVLMTDGENTEGASPADFDDFYGRLPDAARHIPVFPILFGDSDRDELEHIAEVTGGRLFDATRGSLDGAFEEIRGYQ